jgi:hypothetical protein
VGGVVEKEYGAWFDKRKPKSEIFQQVLMNLTKNMPQG